MGISISITAGKDQSASAVNASGSIQHVVTDEERTTFKLDDEQLKNAVNAYFGKRPNDAYLHSPTPWDDLYKRYHWNQVQTIVVVQSAEILEITSEPIMLKSQEFVNGSSVAATFNVGLTDSVSDTTSSTWSSGGVLTIGQKITYSISFLGTGGGGETSLSYSQSWGSGGQESKTITVGSSSGVSVRLDPGESVVSELSASRGVMRVRVRYNAYLSDTYPGGTAVNYDPRYKGHHFWCLDIGSVMSAGDIANSVQTTEDIEIGYYSNSKIELKDKMTGTLKATYFMADIPGH